MTSQTKKITYAGLMAALTFISTSILAFPIAFTNGYIHLGDGFVLSCGVLLGKKYGALAAGIGSALADIALGYAQWALPTFIIKFTMAFIVGYAFEAISDPKRVRRIGLIFSTLWVVFMALILYMSTLQNHISKASDGLIEEGLLTDLSQLSSRTTFTQTAVLLSMIVIPGLIFLCMTLFKNNDKKSLFLHKLIVFFVAGALMILLYYIAYGIMFGSWIVPIFSIPSNLIQYILGILVVTFLLPMTQKFAIISE